MPENDEWRVYSKLVLSELKRLDEEQNKLEDKQDRMDERMTLMRSDIAKLQVKAGMWGFIAGVIPTAIGIVWLLLTR